MLCGTGLPAAGIKYGDMTREMFAACGHAVPRLLAELPDGTTVHEAYELLARSK
jgi:hypothetical protein